MKFSFGTRKVNVDRCGFVVYLPSVWARNAQLQKGSEVEILMNDEGSLLLVPVKSETTN